MKNINQKAPVQCSQTILIDAPLEHVWSVLTNISRWTIWHRQISSVRLQGAIEVGRKFSWKTGGAKITSVLHTVDPAHQFGWTGRTFGMFAIHNWTLRAKSEVTEVTVNESMQGVLATLFQKTFNKNLEENMTAWLEFLKIECERKPVNKSRSSIV